MPIIIDGMPWIASQGDFIKLVKITHDIAQEIIANDDKTSDHLRILQNELMKLVADDN